MSKKADKINPKHYKKSGHKSCIDEMSEEFSRQTVFGFCIGSAKKYIYRAGSKDGESFRDDIEKAKWYIAKAIWLAETDVRDSEVEKITSLLKGVSENVSRCIESRNN